MSNKDIETALKSDKCQLQADLARLLAVASNFLNRYDALQATHDSYGLFTARNDLSYVLKCLQARQPQQPTASTSK